MTAKRNTSQRKTSVTEARDECDIIEVLKNDPLLLELAEEIVNPQLPSEEELRDEDMLAFSYSIHELPASLEPPADFVSKWERLLDWHAEKEREWLLENTGKTHAGMRLVQRRWAVLNRVRNAYDYLEMRPSPELHAIPIIVVNWHGTWDLPTSLRATVIQHPIYRALKAELPEATPKNNLLHRLQWAMSLSGNEEEEDRLLASLAHECDAMLHDADMFDFPDNEWLRVAREQDDFWKLLETVFDFGRRHAYWQTYRDGTVSKASRKGLLDRGGKSPDKWGVAVKLLVAQYVQEVGTYPPPSKLFTSLGGVRDDNDDNIPLRFEKPNGSILDGILWNEFVNRVDSAKK
jgi:hypothetical protein